MLNPTFTRSEAVEFSKRNKRSNQIYLKKFDVDVVFRKGKNQDPKLTKVRHKEDDRPESSYNTRMKSNQPKKNDIVTYKINGNNEIFVLAKSGGVSLFDGMSSKVTLGKNDCWWVITKNAKIPDSIIIAKDLFVDSEGNRHYSIEPEKDMPLKEFKEKLKDIESQMQRKT